MEQCLNSLQATVRTEVLYYTVMEYGTL